MNFLATFGSCGGWYNIGLLGFGCLCGGISGVWVGFGFTDLGFVVVRVGFGVVGGASFLVVLVLVDWCEVWLLTDYICGCFLGCLDCG